MNTPHSPTNIALPPTEIILTHRRMLALAVPMMLSHITVPLLGLVDTVVIGRLGDAALLGGVALGSVVFDLLLWTFGSLRMTTIGLTAQATGARDSVEAERVLARAMVLGLAIGLAMVALQQPIGSLARQLAGASPEVTAALTDYFNVRIWSAPATLLNYVLLGALLGRGRSDLGLVLQIAINLSNAGLSILFVAGFGWAVAGAALGTVLAEVLGVILGFALLVRLGVSLRRIGERASYARAAILAALASNRDVAIRNLCLLMVFVLFSRTGAKNGDVALAANAILQNLWLFGSYILDGFATAAETLCGMALGARQPRAFRRAVRLSLGWSLGAGLFLSALTLFGGGAFIAFATPNEVVRHAALVLLPFAALMPLVGATAFAYDGIFIGGGWGSAMRNQMLIASTGFLTMLWLLSSYGNAGLWLAMLAFMALRGVLQAAMYPALAARSFGPGDLVSRPSR